jgi:two-component system heavy metal sensor histidine kinase CusS
MKRSFKLHVFLSVTLCVVVFVGASRFAVRWASGEPFRIYFSEILAQHAQRELDSSPSQVDFLRFQSNLEKTVTHLQPNDMLVFSEGAMVTAQAAAFGLLLNSSSLTWEQLQTRPFETTTIGWEKSQWRVVRTESALAPIYIAVKASVFQRSLDEILMVRNQISITMLPILIIFIAITTTFIIYAVLSPIRKLQAAFAHIKLSNSHEHLDANNNFKEFSAFIGYFNRLIDRLRASYTQAARFSSDAAHELRTPLTVIRGNLHRLINQAQDGSNTQMQLTLVADEVERLISISNKLLFLSQADAGQIGLEKQEINFNNMMGQMLDDARSFHPDLKFSSDIQGKISIQADHDLIFQLMSNLLGNAIKYNQPGGSVTFHAKVIHHTLHFSFTNSTHLTITGLNERVFERFYRHREAIGHGVSHTSGAGLGLSLCQEIVKVHRGKIQLTVLPDQRVCVKCELPLVR